MIRRSTFILLLVFIVLLAGVAFWQRTKGSEEIEGTPTAVQEYLFEINGQIKVDRRIMINLFVFSGRRQQYHQAKPYQVIQ